MILPQDLKAHFENSPNYLAKKASKEKAQP